MEYVKINELSITIQKYLEKEKIENAKPKDLMPILIKKGYFLKDHRNGLPLRNLLRDLDRNNQLHLLPQVRVERKEKNTFWFFSPVYNTFINKVSVYLEQNKEHPFNRYNSWNHCYNAFGSITDSKLLSLHLGFYLASWGMYRGSSKLLQKDYLVHEGGVEILKAFSSLRCSKTREITVHDIDTILQLISELKAYYKSVLGVLPSNTLISKIILGTLGCLPAFDRYFCDGVKEQEKDFRSLTKKSLLLLFEYMENRKDDINKIRKQHSEIYYPNMKLVDMYFWQIGFEKDNG